MTLYGKSRRFMTFYGLKFLLLNLRRFMTFYDSAETLLKTRKKIVKIKQTKECKINIIILPGIF